MHAVCMHGDLGSRTESGPRPSAQVRLPLKTAGFLVTAETSSAYHRIIRDLESGRCMISQRARGRGLVVARGGVEPPTYRFSVDRSYQLSYLAVRPERNELAQALRP